MSKIIAQLGTGIKHLHFPEYCTKKDLRAPYRHPQRSLSHCTLSAISLLKTCNITAISDRLYHPLYNPCLSFSLLTVVYANIGNATKSSNPIPRVIISGRPIRKRLAPARITVHIPNVTRLNTQSRFVVFMPFSFLAAVLSGSCPGRTAAPYKPCRYIPPIWR